MSEEGGRVGTYQLGGRRPGSGYDAGETTEEGIEIACASAGEKGVEEGVGAGLAL